MLGWLLREAGDAATARTMFEHGASDPSERIRASGDFFRARKSPSSLRT